MGGKSGRACGRELELDGERGKRWKLLSVEWRQTCGDEISVCLCWENERSGTLVHSVLNRTTFPSALSLN